MKLYNLSSFLMLYESLKYFFGRVQELRYGEKIYDFLFSDVWYILDTTSVFLA